MSASVKFLKLSLLAGAGFALVACSSANSSARYGGGSDAYGYSSAYEGGRYGYESSRYGYEYGYGQQAMGGYCDQAAPALRSRYGGEIQVQQNCMPYPPIMMAPPQMQTYQYASTTPAISTDCPSGSSWNVATSGCVQNETTEYVSNYTSTTSTVTSTDCPAGSSWNSELSMCVQSESTYTPPSVPAVIECPAGSYRSMDGTSCVQSTTSYPTPSISVDWTPIRK